MKFATLLLFASLLPAQTLINLGGPAVSGYLADSSFCPSGTPYVVPVAVSPAIYQTERYGAFTCTVPLPNGTYPVTLDLMENRRASGVDGAVGVGVRLFSVAINGVSTGQLDIFAAVGSLVPYQVKLTVPVTNGQMVFSWIAVAGKGNPVGSAIEIGAALPVSIPLLQPGEIPLVSGVVVQLQDGSERFVPLGPSIAVNPPGTLGLVIPGIITAWLKCVSAPGPNSIDCDGLDFFSVLKPDGTPVGSFIGLAPPPGFMLTATPNWVPVQ